MQQPSAPQAGHTEAGQKPARIPVLQGSLTEILGYLSKELPKFPRRVPGRLLADGVELRYVDLHSFYYQSLQILNHRLYEFETDEAALPPRASMALVASSRVKRVSAPVRTKVLPANVSLTG